MKLFMTSSPLGAYRSTEAPTFKGLDPANGLVEELASCWREDSRCLYITAFPEEYAVNDRIRADFERIIRETGLSDYSGPPAHPGRSSAQSDRASAHLKQSADQHMSAADQHTR